VKPQDWISAARVLVDGEEHVGFLKWASSEPQERWGRARRGSRPWARCQDGAAALSRVEGRRRSPERRARASVLYRVRAPATLVPWGQHRWIRVGGSLLSPLSPIKQTLYHLSHSASPVPPVLFCFGFFPR
jgi:hypothetical protein